MWTDYKSSESEVSKWLRSNFFLLDEVENVFLEELMFLKLLISKVDKFSDYIFENYYISQNFTFSRTFWEHNFTSSEHTTKTRESFYVTFLSNF